MDFAFWKVCIRFAFHPFAMIHSLSTRTGTIICFPVMNTRTMHSDTKQLKWQIYCFRKSLASLFVLYSVFVIVCVWGILQLYTIINTSGNAFGCGGKQKTILNNDFTHTHTQMRALKSVNIIAGVLQGCIQANLS